LSSETGFWDSSALTALFVKEAITELVLDEVQRITPVVWWATTVEIHSAFSRLLRSGLLTEADWQAGVARLDLLNRDWKVILPADNVHEIATEVLYRYSLRAADSLQLAAAMVWCQQKPAGRKFVCQDVRLGAAAAEIGFDIIRFGDSPSRA
jgi:predicted nucleic acid-binding protein